MPAPLMTPAALAERLSPRARELNQKLIGAIEEFQRYYPDTSDSDVLSALRSVEAGRGRSPTRARAAVVAAVAAAIAGLGVIVFTRAATTNPDLITIVAPIAAAVGAAIAIVRLSRRS